MKDPKAPSSRGSVHYAASQEAKLQDEANPVKFRDPATGQSVPLAKVIWMIS